MKVLYCPECLEFVRLRDVPRRCPCRQSWGRYTNDRDVIVSGPGVVVGVDNLSFTQAVAARLKSRLGLNFNAFVIAEPNARITRVADGDSDPEGRRPERDPAPRRAASRGAPRQGGGAGLGATEPGGGAEDD